MRISVNLATRPYVELQPFFVRLRLVMAALAVVALGLGIAGHFVSAKLDRAQAEMDNLRYRTIAAQQEKLHAEQRMRLPANAAVLDRAHFLNRLFVAKSFSWTAVLMDLETVLPTGVQVTSIEPQVTASGEVVIRLKVSGERDRAIQLVRNLEHSRRFLKPRLSGESTLTKETGNGQRTVANAGAPVGTEFDILADYNPLPENESYHFARTDAGEAKAAATGVSKPQRKPQRAGNNSRYGVVLAPYAPRPVQNGGAPR